MTESTASDMAHHNDFGVPVLDPDGARQGAIDAGLVERGGDPLNCETPIPALVFGQAMPTANFFVRNHFGIPNLDPSTWRLRVDGQVERPLSLTLDDIQRLPSQSLTVTLECAGNGRAFLHPRVDGEQWELGAVSTAQWTGVLLAEVLAKAGIKQGARDVVFRGADGGAVSGRDEPIRYERSLGVDEAFRSGALLAFAMNGEPLPRSHGFPLRLVVPGWYGVAAVKWLTEIEVSNETFAGFYQADRYCYEWQRSGTVLKVPVSLQRVRAMVTQPASHVQVEPGEVAVRGVAWSGAAPIARVEVRVDEGQWRGGRLVGEGSRYGWVWWELLVRLDKSGPVTLSARATDLAGRTQPERPEWNRLGYGSNAIHKVTVEVRPNHGARRI